MHCSDSISDDYLTILASSSADTASIAVDRIVTTDEESFESCAKGSSHHYCVGSLD